MSETAAEASIVQESEEFWDRFTASASLHPANLYRYTLISNLISGWPGSRSYIVDLGCGNGVLLKHLHERQLGQKLMGVDGSMAIIERNRRNLSFAEFFQADLQIPDSFPLRGKADVVVCSEVIEHMPVYQPVFKIAHDCLKSGGIFILTTQGGRRRRHDIKLLGHLRHYDIDQLAGEVSAAGFDIIHKQEAGWPALTAQKIAASLFMGRVEQELASKKEPSALFKLASKVIGLGLRFSSKKRGPQLLIAARKN